MLRRVGRGRHPLFPQSSPAPRQRHLAISPSTPSTILGNLNQEEVQVSRQARQAVHVLIHREVKLLDRSKPDVDPDL